MSRRIIFVIALLAIVAGVFFYKSRGSSSKADEETKTETADKTLDALKNRRDKRLASKQMPGTISGVVLDHNKAPIQSARISIAPKTLEGMLGNAGESVEPLVVFSDERGHFEAKDLLPAIYSATASARGFIPTSQPSITVNPEQDSNIELNLTKGGVRVFGTVNDIGGGPIPQAIVQSHRWDGFKISTLLTAPASSITNDNGEYELWLATGSYSIDASHADYVTSDENIQLKQQERKLDFIMTPGAVVEGTVIAKSTGEPIEHALVTSQGIDDAMPVKGIGLGGSVRTDAKGHFILRNLKNGSIQLSAIAKQAVSTTPTIVDLSIAETVSDVVLELDDAFSISGFVVQDDEDASPLPGVMLGAYNFSPGVLIAATEPSDESGYFEIHGVSPGTYNVGAAGDDRVPNLMGTSVSIKDENIEDLVVKLRTGYTLRGRIEPPMIAAISLGIAPEKMGIMDIVNAVSAAIAKTTSNPDGTFTLSGVDSGSFEVIAKANSGMEGRSPVTIFEDMDNIIVLMEERATARGRVIDTRGEAVSGAKVKYSRTEKEKTNISIDVNMWREAQSTTGPDGLYEIRGLKPGSYTVGVRNYELKDSIPPIAIEGVNDPAELTIEVKAKSESIRGKVLGPEGEAVADAWVSVKKMDRYSTAKDEYALSDENGQFVINNLSKGSYTLSAEGLRGSAKKSVEDAKTGEFVTIRLRTLGQIEGKVVSQNSSLDTFVVRTIGPTNRKISVVDAAGNFVMTKLDPGDYKVLVETNKGQGEAKTVVKEGKSATVEITLGEFGSVYGQLVDGNTNEPMTGYAVVASTKNGRNEGQAFTDMMMGTLPKTDDEGRFRIGGLGIGKGDIVFMDTKKKGFEPAAIQQFELKNGEDLDLGVIKSSSPDIGNNVEVTVEHEE